MLINTLADAYYWLSLLNKAKEGDKTALDKINSANNENINEGNPTIEEQLRKLHKDDNGSLISNDGIDWKNNGYKHIPEIKSIIDAERVLGYYMSLLNDKDIQSWDDISNKSLDGYIANIGYQIILDGKTSYESWRNEMYKRLKPDFNQISEYYLKKAIAKLWIKKFNITEIDSKDNLFLIARKKRYSIFRFLDNEKCLYTFMIIWALGLFFWLIYKDYNIGATLSLGISLLSAGGGKDDSLSRIPIVNVFLLLLMCCVLISLSEYVAFLYHYGAEFAKYITIWSIIGLLSYPIYLIQEDIQKQKKLFAEDCR